MKLPTHFFTGNPFAVRDILRRADSLLATKKPTIHVPKRGSFFEEMGLTHLIEAHQGAHRLYLMDDRIPASVRVFISKDHLVATVAPVVNEAMYEFEEFCFANKPRLVTNL